MPFSLLSKQFFPTHFSFLAFFSLFFFRDLLLLRQNWKGHWESWNLFLLFFFFSTFFFLISASIYHAARGENKRNTERKGEKGKWNKKANETRLAWEMRRCRHLFLSPPLLHPPLATGQSELSTPLGIHADEKVLLFSVPPSALSAHLAALMRSRKSNTTTHPPFPFSRYRRRKSPNFSTSPCVLWHVGNSISVLLCRLRLLLALLPFHSPRPFPLRCTSKAGGGGRHGFIRRPWPF